MDVQRAGDAPATSAESRIDSILAAARFEVSADSRDTAVWTGHDLLELLVDDGADGTGTIAARVSDGSDRTPGTMAFTAPAVGTVYTIRGGDDELHALRDAHGLLCAVYPLLLHGAANRDAPPTLLVAECRMRQQCRILQATLRNSIRSGIMVPVGAYSDSRLLLHADTTDLQTQGYARRLFRHGVPKPEADRLADLARAWCADMHTIRRQAEAVAELAVRLRESPETAPSARATALLMRFGAIVRAGRRHVGMDHGSERGQFATAEDALAFVDAMDDLVRMRDAPDKPMPVRRIVSGRELAGLLTHARRPAWASLGHPPVLAFDGPDGERRVEPDTGRLARMVCAQGAGLDEIQRRQNELRNHFLGMARIHAGRAFDAPVPKSPGPSRAPSR